MKRFYILRMVVLSLGIIPSALYALGTKQLPPSTSPSREIKEEATSLRIGKSIGAGLLSAFCLVGCAAFVQAGFHNVTHTYEENSKRFQGTVKGLFVLNCAALLFYTAMRAAGYSFNRMKGGVA